MRLAASSASAGAHLLDRLRKCWMISRRCRLRKQVSENPNDYEAKANLARIYIERRQGDLAAPGGCPGGAARMTRRQTWPRCSWHRHRLWLARQ